jgi:hypothetical protein
MTQSELHAKVAPEMASCIGDWMYLNGKQIHSCPICGKELVYTGDEKLETLNEHVSDPNGEPVLKFCFKCPWDCCLANILNFSWSSEGGLYMTGNYTNTNQIKFKDDIHSSIGSFDREMDETRAQEKARTFNIRIGKVEFYSLLHLEFQLYPNNPLYWTVVIWWKGRYITSFPGTIIWKVKRYFRKEHSNRI